MVWWEFSQVRAATRLLLRVSELASASAKAVEHTLAKFDCFQSRVRDVLAFSL